MNILFVTGVFAENKWDTALGGMANAVYKSAIGMQQRGHRVRVLTVDDIDRRWCYQEIGRATCRKECRIGGRSGGSPYHIKN